MRLAKIKAMVLDLLVCSRARMSRDTRFDGKRYGCAGRRTLLPSDLHCT